MAQFDQNVHSDFLIHWTGKDIDRDDPDWDHPGYYMRPEIAERYAERLATILTDGFWMTTEPARSVTVKPHAPIEIPPIERTCFTELKLSLSRQHAHQYGRLGVGMKRPYAVRRQGRPLVYYAYYDETDDPFVYACLRDLKDRELLGYLQPMNRPKDPSVRRRMIFDLYFESEWRIVYRPVLDDAGYTVPPPADWLTRPGPSPKRLLPLDGWLSMIIYPCIEVKRLCQEHGGPVQKAIEKIKSDLSDHGNRVEPGNWPAEINLDDCRNF